MVAVNGKRVLRVRARAAMSERRELTQALLTWVDRARQEPGTAGAHLSEDLEEPGTYCLCAAWSAQADFEAHVAGPDFGVLLGALEVLGHGVRFDLTGTEGCAEDPGELIRRLRRRNPDAERSGETTTRDTTGDPGPSDPE